ncbi:MAG: PaaI family thioesterase [bacterium]|nr:MAG: PaaI family thioesterase [bacterium]
MEQIPIEGCFGCGIDNQSGLKATFRNMGDGGVEGFFTPQQHHCGYSDVVHVGPITGFLSEVMGRLAFHKDQYYLTRSMSITFKCSVSPGVKLHAMAKIKKHHRSHFTAEASVYGPEGELIATGEGSFITMQSAEAKRVAGKK